MLPERTLEHEPTADLPDVLSPGSVEVRTWRQEVTEGTWPLGPSEHADEYRGPDVALYQPVSPSRPRTLSEPGCLWLWHAD